MTRSIGLLGCLIGFSLAHCALAMQWNLNDVSYLFRLPEGDAKAPVDLLGPEDRGGAGPLLPQAIYERLPTLLINGDGNRTLYRDALRVISARIDPCPIGADSSCSPQVRLIWQPVQYDRFAGKWVARDAAVHSFYALSAGELESLKRELWAIKVKFAQLGVNTTLEALGIHPALRNRQTAGTFNQDIQRLLLERLGENNLERVTYIALLVPTKWWRFGAFDKERSGSWRMASIPRLDTPTEDIFNVATHDGIGLGPEKGLDAVFNVLPEEYPEADRLFAVINKSYRFNDARDRPVFRDKLDTLARFQNPLKTNTENLDCASCHYADATRYYMGNRFQELDHTRSVEAFQNPDPELFNLDNRTLAATSTRNVRAFGFFDDRPVISQRTINESALSAHWLNTHQSQQKTATPVPSKTALETCGIPTLACSAGQAGPRGDATEHRGGG